MSEQKVLFITNPKDNGAQSLKNVAQEMFSGVVVTVSEGRAWKNALWNQKYNAVIVEPYPDRLGDTFSEIVNAAGAAQVVVFSSQHKEFLEKKGISLGNIAYFQRADTETSDMLTSLGCEMKA